MITADIKFKCAHCGQSILVEVEAAGRATKCPTCRIGLTIPALAALNERTYEVSSRAGKRDKARTNGSLEDFRGGESDLLKGPSMKPISENGRVDHEAHDHRAEVARAREQLAASHAECERLKATTTHAQAELKSFQAERLTLKNDLQLQRQRLTSTETQLTARELGLSEKAVALEKLTTERSALEMECAGMRSELAATRIEVKTTKTALSKAQSELGRERTAVEKVRGKLTTLQTEAKAVADERDALRGETQTLRSLLNETENGRELTTARAGLAAAETERQELRQAASALGADLATSRAAVERLEKVAAGQRARMDEALRKAEAMSEDRVQQDNAILRGIVARQNTELEVRHREIVKLKRAKLALRIAYTLFGLGLVALAYVALQLLPGLPFEF